ncbi:MAG: porin family protein [Bacteroidota bacterium]|nr:porin family protein [Bacteroidota bacterium]MEC8400951.1 porin family protein [Bacteroidota bacterium]
MKRIPILIGLVLLMLSTVAQAQRGRKNLPNFDSRLYHFGFILSANSSDFNFAVADSAADSFRGVNNVPQAGFNMHLMASYTLSRHWRLRFVPGLSFQDRGLDYTIEGSNNVVKRTEAVNLDIPLLLKWRTDRVDNVAAYALFGVKYARDFQSQENVNQQLQSDNILRLKSGNIAADIGAGIDIFLPFFKLAIQAKTEHGLRNVLIPDDSIYASPLDFLRTRSFVLSFCFEG